MAYISMGMYVYLYYVCVVNTDKAVMVMRVIRVIRAIASDRFLSNNPNSPNNPDEIR